MRMAVFRRIKAEWYLMRKARVLYHALLDIRAYDFERSRGPVRQMPDGEDYLQVLFEALGAIESIERSLSAVDCTWLTGPWVLGRWQERRNDSIMKLRDFIMKSAIKAEPS